MDVDLEKIVVSYFGFTPARKMPRDVKMEFLDTKDVQDPLGVDSIKIKWDNHIGSETRVARLTPLDILYYLALEVNNDNYVNAVESLKYLGKKYRVPIVKIGEQYLLINPKHRG